MKLEIFGYIILYILILVWFGFLKFLFEFRYFVRFNEFFLFMFIFFVWLFWIYEILFLLGLNKLLLNKFLFLLSF